MIRTLLERFRDDSLVVYECRHCGTSLEDETGSCPACGSDEVVIYEIDEP